jgi:hypothetical protein
MKVKLNSNYWDQRYQTKEIGGDIGTISAPLKAYFDQLENKNVSILIPGAGNGHEAAYLFAQGFTHITVLDYSNAAIANFKKSNPLFPASNCICLDFFKLEGSFDLIIEQTFFCALKPDLRTNYVHKMQQLLKPKGKLVGVLFTIPLNTNHPPFGGNSEAYKLLFDPFFEFRTFELCNNSIAPRMGSELFINLIKK